MGIANLLYRADKRDFVLGEIISSAGDFLDKNPKGTKAVEDIFERIRPRPRPARSSSLYLFVDKEAALKHWCKLIEGKLYGVQIATNANVHLGDMRLVEQAYRSRDNLSIVDDLARRYWHGELTPKPTIEVLVECASIARIFSKLEAERRAYFEHYALAKPRPAFAWELDAPD